MVHTTKQTRGYTFENKDIVKKVNELGEDWHARRMGGSSSGLPDIIITNNKKHLLIVMEAKSGTGDYLLVPYDQVERCYKLLKMFDVYNNKIIMFAFKFLNNRSKDKERMSKGEKRREVKTYFHIHGIGEGIHAVACKYGGDIIIQRKLVENISGCDTKWFIEFLEDV